MTHEPPTVVQALAAWAHGCAADPLPDEVLADVRLRVMDSLGIMIAARETTAEGRVVQTVLAADGGAPLSTPLAALGSRLPAAAAAMVNGTLAHSLDFDDTHLPSVLHPSASVVPAALAAAEAHGVDGARLAAAVATGIEVSNRLGMASYDTEMRNSVMFENGFHATSICGTVGSAVAVAVIQGLSVDGIAHAMGVAASMGSGIIEANRTGGTVKRIHCGWAAHAGIRAASLAGAGITGPPTVIEGRFGFLHAFSAGRFSVDGVVDGLGERWELLRTHFKPYPANHFTHAAIDAARAMRLRGLDPATIRSAELGVAAPTLRTIAQPPEQKASPPTPYAAQFSGPFVLATALMGGGGLGVYLDDFTDATVADPRLLELAAKVTCVADAESTEHFPHEFPAVLTITTDDGSVWEERVRHNRGGPGNPLRPDELEYKFRLNAGRSLDDATVDDLAAAVARLGQGTGAADLLAPAGANR